MMIQKRMGGMHRLVMKVDLVLVERAVVGGSLVNGGTACRNRVAWWLFTRGN